MPITIAHKLWVIQIKKTRTVYGGTNKEFKSFMSNICNQAKRRVDETSRSRASSISGKYIMIILGNFYMIEPMTSGQILNLNVQVIHYQDEFINVIIAWTIQMQVLIHQDSHSKIAFVM